jgi:hypothetical protein
VTRELTDSIMPHSEALRFLPASVLFLPDLFFDPEDGSDMFLRNIGRYNPQDRTLHTLILIKVSSFQFIVYYEEHVSQKHNASILRVEEYNLEHILVTVT